MARETCTKSASPYACFQSTSAVEENLSSAAGDLCVIKSGLCHLEGRGPNTNLHSDALAC